MQATKRAKREPGVLPGGTLYPFQVEGVRYVHAHRGRAIIGDKRGVGKTPQALAWMYYQPRLRPVLIVVPATIKKQWARELMKWLDLPEAEVTVVYSRKKREFTTPYVIINYDILAAHKEALVTFQPRMVIYDELHRLKTKAAQRSKAAIAIAHQPSVISRLGLTGSEYENRPLEGWHQDFVINSSVFPNEWAYKMRYCNPLKKNTTAKRDDEGNIIKGADGEPVWNTAWEFNGASNVDELNRIRRERLFIRRTKKEVYPEMPELQRVTMPLDCDLKDYRTLLREVKVRLTELRAKYRARRQELEGMSPLQQKRALAHHAETESLTSLHGVAWADISDLRKAAGLAKIPHTLDWMRDVMEEGTPMLLFVHHHEVSDALLAGLNEMLEEADFRDRGWEPVPPPLDSRMTFPRRDQAVQDFVDGKVPCLIAGIRAMSEGYDGLQYATSHLAFVELDWNETKHDQAEGRADRVGQEEQVTSYFLMATGTLDDQLSRVIDAKGTVTAASYGEMPDPGILESLIDFIIEEA